MLRNGAEMVNGDVEVEAMSKEAVCKVVQGLQAGLQARERQLERQGQQLAAMQEVQHQLQVAPHTSTCLPALHCQVPHLHIALHCSCSDAWVPSMHGHCRNLFVHSAKARALPCEGASAFEFASHASFCLPALWIAPSCHSSAAAVHASS